MGWLRSARHRTIGRSFSGDAAVVNGQLDPQWPATLSPATVTGVLSYEPHRASPSWVVAALVRDGALNEERIDESVQRVRELKLRCSTRG